MKYYLTDTHDYWMRWSVGSELGDIARFRSRAAAREYRRRLENAGLPQFPPVEAGEWVRPPEDEMFKMQCCDCGLIHDLEFAIQDDRVIFRAFRDGEAY